LPISFTQPTIALLVAVPEGVAQSVVILHGNGADGGGGLEGALLEQHDAGVVDAGALGEDEDGHLAGVLHVLLQPAQFLSKLANKIGVKFKFNSNEILIEFNLEIQIEKLLEKTIF
jgi:hypothetical protein